MLVVSHVPARVHRSETGRYYGLAPIHAAPGLHEAAAEAVQRHVAKGGCILELGAGSGAMTQRLLDLGYRVTPVDLDDAGWRCPAASLHLCDFNHRQWFQAFSATDWHAIVALEVIEHLDAPRQFVSALGALAAPGGVCLLSTPNVTSARSLLRAALTGSFSCFGRKEYFATGHVSLVPWWLLGCYAEEAGLAVSEVRFVGEAEGSMLKKVPARLLQKLLNLIRPEGKRPHSRDAVISLVTLHKPKEPSLAANV